MVANDVADDPNAPTDGWIKKMEQRVWVEGKVSGDEFKTAVKSRIQRVLKSSTEPL
jgi:tripartite-type tricarboxylate transporter receptor subunit TctC